MSESVARATRAQMRKAMGEHAVSQVEGQTAAIQRLQLQIATHETVLRNLERLLRDDVQFRSMTFRARLRWLVRGL